uniref:Uncharacterized protein n=1 Tax=Arundo donax TaxID=35708 RepID=A0A0A9HXT2_ARUDO
MFKPDLWAMGLNISALRDLHASDVGTELGLSRIGMIRNEIGCTIWPGDVHPQRQSGGCGPEG